MHNGPKTPFVHPKMLRSAEKTPVCQIVPVSGGGKRVEGGEGKGEARRRKREEGKEEEEGGRKGRKGGEGKGKGKKEGRVGGLGSGVESWPTQLLAKKHHLSNDRTKNSGIPKVSMILYVSMWCQIFSSCQNDNRNGLAWLTRWHQCSQFVT